MKQYVLTIACIIFTACSGFKGAFTDKTSFAKANSVIYLTVSDGSTAAGKSLDLNGDGIADGLDLNGDGRAEILYNWIIPGQLAGLDLNGDGKSDYYMNQGLNGKITLYTQPTGGTPVTLVKDANGNIIGFDSTGDGVANSTILQDIYADNIRPTSAANSSGGIFNTSQQVTITCTDNIACESIAYTLNGSTPNFTGNGAVLVGHTGTLTVTKSSTLNWLARDTNGNLQLTMGTAAFTILGANVALPPTYSPTAGFYGIAQSVALSSSTSGATICYTTNLTAPACNSAAACTTGSAYSSTIPVASVMGIQAISCKVGLTTSPVAIAIFIIDTTPPGAVTGFAAIAGDTQVSLSWTNPADTDLSGIKILRKTGGYSANNSDGTVVSTSLTTAITDTGLTNATQYYYSAFAYDAAGNYTLVGQQATATPNGGLTNAPTFSPVAGTYGATQNVTISSTTSGTMICYTTNGVDPGCSAVPACTTSTTYVSAVSIPATVTLKAMACKLGNTNSTITSGLYTIDTTPPGNVTAFNATPGNTQISLTWTNPGAGDLAGIKILRKTGGYPTDENDGTVVYNSTGTSITDTGLTNGTQYYYTAYAYDTIGNYASGTQLTATPASGPVNAPTYSPVAGTFGGTQNVTISTSTGGAILCYTTDGSAPACTVTPTCSAGATYSVAVSISSTSTLRAIGCASGYSDSSISSGVYTIDTTAPNNPTVPLYTAGNTQVTLGWRNSNSGDSVGVKIVRATGGTAPANCNSGTILCTGAACNANLTPSQTLRTFIDTGLTNGTQYSYRICAIDGATNLSAGITGSATPNNDAADVAADKAALAMGYNGGDTVTNVRNNLTLASSGGNGSTITWASNNTTYISNAGVVTRPVFGLGDQTVTMTATITKGSASDTKPFVLTVKQLTTCTVYTSGWFRENCNGTVSDTTHGITWKKCSQGQTYNSSTGACDGSLSNFAYCPANNDSCNGGTPTGNLTSGPGFDSCNALNSSPPGGYAGITTWRVPTKTELKLIVYCSSGPSTPLADYFFCSGGSPPFVHLEFFNNFPGSGDYHMSSTSSASTQFWFVNDSQADANGAKNSTGWKVICTSD